MRLCTFCLRKGVRLRLTNEFALQTRCIYGTVVLFTCRFRCESRAYTRLRTIVPQPFSPKAHLHQLAILETRHSTRIYIAVPLRFRSFLKRFLRDKPIGRRGEKRQSDVAETARVVHASAVHCILHVSSRRFLCERVK